MKIRIKNNSIRYRLDKIDIENIKTAGLHEEKTSIGEENLVFSIKSIDKGAAFINLMPYSVETGINSNDFAPLLEGSTAGITFTIPNPDGSEVKLLIERDFKCLVPRGEDDQYAFDNPLDTKARS